MSSIRPPKRCWQGTTSPLMQNAAASAEAVFAERAAAAMKNLDGGWAAAGEAGAVLRALECWELFEQEGSWRQRTFVWRSAGSAWTAVSFCPLHDRLPELVCDSMAL